MKKKPFVVQHTYYILLCSVKDISIYTIQMRLTSLKVQGGCIYLRNINKQLMYDKELNRTFLVLKHLLNFKY